MGNLRDSLCVRVPEVNRNFKVDILHETPNFVLVKVQDVREQLKPGYVSFDDKETVNLRYKDGRLMKKSYHIIAKRAAQEYMGLAA
jgi:hypothetical protein